MSPRENPSDYRPDRIEWFTVSYRSLGIVAGLILVAAAAGWWFFLQGPSAPTTTTPATVAIGSRFTFIEGSVEVKRAGELDWVTATTAMTLRQNDLVRTRAGAAAEIVLGAGDVVKLGPETLFTIVESSQNTVSRQQRVALAIQSGEANFQTGTRSVPGETTISTPTVRTTADRETSGNIQVDESGETGVRIFQGSGRAETSQGQRIDLRSNEGIRIQADGTAGEKVTLPTVPVLTAPPNETEVSYPDPSRAITLLMWNAVTDATAYRVMVDFSQSFARPLYDRQGFKGTQMELRGLETGTYYWRVAAVGDDGDEGAFGGPHRFTLLKAPASAASPPPLQVDTLELRGNILHVRGRTSPGATLTLDGVRIEVQPDGTFNEFVAFESDANTVLLRSTGLNGAAAQQRRPIVVTN